MRYTATVSRSSLSSTTGSDLLDQMKPGQLLAVDSHKRGGLIVFKPFHAEFAGPGAAFGSVFDQDCVGVLPVGDFAAVSPQSQEDRQKAYLIRRQWIRLIQQITDNPESVDRVRMLINQFNNYFDWRTVSQLPDEAFALMVGVLPQTVGQVRSRLGQID
ncbi:MAG: hypothetical protein HC805_02765 [Alkalinema sp. RL_2_19]|nr:hypothetical protein [Alkalinema sp. RL_2_19]